MRTDIKVGEAWCLYKQSRGWHTTRCSAGFQPPYIPQMRTCIAGMKEVKLESVTHYLLMLSGGNEMLMSRAETAFLRLCLDWQS